MPAEKIIDYVFAGAQTVLIYSEAEMAAALRMSVSELHSALNGGHHLVYHAHPNATGSGYEFNEDCYWENIVRYRCLVSGGHFWQWNRYYDERMKKSVYSCPCGAEHYDI